MTEELKRDSNEFLNKLDTSNEVMFSLKVPKSLQNEVRTHILTTHSLKRL